MLVGEDLRSLLPVLSTGFNGDKGVRGHRRQQEPKSVKVDSITALAFIVYLWSETQSRAHVADGNRSIYSTNEGGVHGCGRWICLEP